MSSAKIAKAKGWLPGTILECSEYGRAPRLYRVTAIGELLVLGRRRGINSAPEIALRLDSGDLKWKVKTIEHDGDVFKAEEEAELIDRQIYDQLRAAIEKASIAA